MALASSPAAARASPLRTPCACVSFDIAANLAGLLETGAVIGFAHEGGFSNPLETRS